MFGFPEINRSLIKEYRGNFLRSVALQIKYSKNNDITSDREYVYSLFKVTLPRIKDVKQSSLQISFNQDDQTPILQPVSNNSLGFEMKSNDGTKILTVLEDVLSYNISGSSYENFSQIQNEISQILDILKKNNVGILSRIAIRKINIVDFSLQGNDNMSPLDVAKMILNNQLVNGIGSFPKAGSIVQNINKVNYSEGEDRLNLIYGLLKQSESDSKNGQVIIDIDLFKEGNLDSNHLVEYFTGINNEVFNIFNWCISENAKSILKNN